MVQCTVIGYEPEALARAEADLNALVPDGAEDLRARLSKGLAAARAHAYRVPAREQGITVTRPEVFVWAAEPLAPEDLRAAAEAFPPRNGPPTLADALNTVAAWASKTLAAASEDLPPPARYFYFPAGACEVSEADAVRIEALGLADLAREVRELLARGEPAKIGTTAPPTPEGTLGWFAWHLFRGVADVAARLRRADGDVAEMGRSAFVLGVLFAEARAKEMHEAEALAGRGTIRGGRKGSDATNARKRDHQAERVAYVKTLDPTWTAHKCARMVERKFDVSHSTALRTVAVARK